MAGTVRASQRAPSDSNWMWRRNQNRQVKKEGKAKMSGVQPVGNVRGSGYEGGQEMFWSQQQQRSDIKKKKRYRKVLSKAPLVKAEGWIDAGFLSS